jgi:hypothetical protein
VLFRVFHNAFHQVLAVFLGDVDQQDYLVHNDRYQFGRG